MLSRLFLVFAVVPVLELWLLITVGGELGAPATIALVLGTAALGAWLARRQGMQAFLRIREQLARGVAPGAELLDGACILVAAVLLATPGFLTDLLGLALLIPASRRAIQAWLRRRFDRAVREGRVVMSGRDEPPPFDI